MAGVVGVLAGDVIGTCLGAGAEAFLDPRVVVDLAVEDVLEVADPVSGEVFAFGDDADADHVVVLGDVPEPAFFGDEGDGGGTFVVAGAALGALVVGPDGDLVKERIAFAPAETDGGEGFLAGGVEGDGGVDFAEVAVFVLHFDAGDAVVFLEEAGDGEFFEDLDAALAGVVDEHLVEVRAEDLPCLGDGIAVVAGVEVERSGLAAVGLDEGDAVFFLEGRGAHLGAEAETFEGVVGEGDEGFADAVAGEAIAVDDDDLVTVFREDGGGAEAGWAGADDDDFWRGGRNHGGRCHGMVMPEIAFQNHSDRGW